MPVDDTQTEGEQRKASESSSTACGSGIEVPSDDAIHTLFQRLDKDNSGKLEASDIQVQRSAPPFLDTHNIRQQLISPAQKPDSCQRAILHVMGQMRDAFEAILFVRLLISSSGW